MITGTIQIYKRHPSAREMGRGGPAPPHPPSTGSPPSATDLPIFFSSPSICSRPYWGWDRETLNANGCTLAYPPTTPTKALRPAPAIRTATILQNLEKGGWLTPPSTTPRPTRAPGPGKFGPGVLLRLPDPCMNPQSECPPPLLFTPDLPPPPV